MAAWCWCWWRPPQKLPSLSLSTASNPSLWPNDGGLDRWSDQKKSLKKSYKVVTFFQWFFIIFFTEWHAEWIRVVRGAPAPNKARKDPNLMSQLLFHFYQRERRNFDTEGETLWFLPASSNMIGGRGLPPHCSGIYEPRQLWDCFGSWKRLSVLKLSSSLFKFPKVPTATHLANATPLSIMNLLIFWRWG